jgi:hypothetical protein
MKFADDHTKDVGKHTASLDNNILLLEDLLRAINAPESGLVTDPVLQSSEQDDGRTSHEIARQIANWQSPPPALKQEPRSIKQVAKAIAIVCLATGAVFLPTIIARLMPKQAPVRQVLVAEPVSRPIAQEAQAEASQAQQITNEVSKPALDTAEAAASINQVQASPQVQASSSAMVQPDEPTQPPPAVPSNTMDTPPEGDRSTAPVEATALFASTPETQPSAPPPPATISQLDISELFDQYLKWKSNHPKPQVQQQKGWHSAKPAAKPNTSPPHPAGTKNAGSKNAPAPSRTKDDKPDPAPPALEETDDKSEVPEVASPARVP